MKILVTDDAGVMRKVIIRELVDLGIPADCIAEASDGKQAVDAVASQAFDLVLMDWNMPNMLGIDAVKEIRAGGHKVPILMVTTEGERTNIIAAIQAGANNYLVKPFTKEDFQDKVRQLIGDKVAVAS